MKKFLALLLSMISVFTVFAFSACDNGEAPVVEKGTVDLKYYNSAAELIPALKTGAIFYGILPEPAATNLENMTKADGKVWYRLDIQELYDADTKSYPQAVMLVKESLLNTYPQLVNSIEAKFSDNVAWVTANPSDAVNAVNSVVAEGVTPSLKPAALTGKTVENCKISWQSAADAKKAVSDYLNDIIAVNQTSAVAATDDLFYNGTAQGEFTAETVQVYCPDGAPALAIAKFISDGENFGTGKTFAYHVVASDNIGATVQKGTGDIVVIPVNAASKLYNKNAADKYKLVSVLTHGNLYIMCSEDISANDLKDKTVGVFGMGLVPDLTFKAVLDKLGFKVEIAD